MGARRDDGRRGGLPALRSAGDWTRQKRRPGPGPGDGRATGVPGVAPAPVAVHGSALRRQELHGERAVDRHGAFAVALSRHADAAKAQVDVTELQGADFACPQATEDHDEEDRLVPMRFEVSQELVVASPAVLAFSSWGNRRACQRLVRPLWLTSRTSSARSARPSARWSGSEPPHDLVGALPPDRGARFPRPRWRPAPLATDPNPPTGSTSDPRGASAGRRTRTACTCARRGGRRSRRGLGT